MCRPSFPLHDFTPCAGRWSTRSASAARQVYSQRHLAGRVQPHSRSECSADRRPETIPLHPALNHPDETRKKLISTGGCSARLRWARLVFGLAAPPCYLAIYPALFSQVGDRAAMLNLLVVLGAAWLWGRSG